MYYPVCLCVLKSSLKNHKSTIACQNEVLQLQKYIYLRLFKNLLTKKMFKFLN